MKQYLLLMLVKAVQEGVAESQNILKGDAQKEASALVVALESFENTLIRDYSR
ncbi:MAG: hypothetical protein RB191_24970 [Terriglobia bacterium]|nr:hypothetical protein [Terriglobia bacterium]